MARDIILNPLVSVARIRTGYTFVSGIRFVVLVVFVFSQQSNTIGQ